MKLNGKCEIRMDKKNRHMRPKRLWKWVVTAVLVVSSTLAVQAARLSKVEVNHVAEVTCVSEKTYRNPFMEIELDAIIAGPNVAQARVPAFWAGDNRWCFRYAASMPGIYAWKLDCSDTSNSRLHGMAGEIEVVPYRGENVLYLHGPIRVAKDQRHFEHADGTPFLWLGDTWWKNLCKRMTWADLGGASVVCR